MLPKDISKVDSYRKKLSLAGKRITKLQCLKLVSKNCHHLIHTNPSGVKE